MKLIKSLLRSTGLKQTLFMISGNTLASGIAAIAIIIYSRFLGPENFGIFSVGFACIQLITRLGDGGINVAIQKNLSQSFESDRSTAKSFILLGKKYKIWLSLFLLIVFLILSQPLAEHWLKTKQLGIVRLSIVFALINIAYDYIAVLHQSMHAFKQAVNMNILQAILKAWWAVLIWIVGISSPIIAFFLYAISPSVGVIYGLLSLPNWLKTTKTKSSANHQKIILDTVKFTSIAVVASAIGDNIDVLMVKSFLSNYETGLYSAGAKLSILVSIIGYSIGTVLDPRVSRYRDLKNLKTYLKKAIAISGALIVSSVVVMPLTKYLILLTSGPQYLAATQAVQMLLIAALITAATAPFISLFYSFNSQSYFAFSGIMQTIILIAANYLLIPIFGIDGAGLAKLLMRIIILIFTIIFASIMLKKTYGKHLLSIITD